MRKLLPVSLLVVLASITLLAADTLDVYYINVGHGDAILVDYGDWECLIDAGKGTIASNAELSEALDLLVEDQTLELAILSHNHWDHFGGFATIFADEDVSISAFWRSTDLQPDRDGDHWKEFSAELREQRFVAEELAAGVVPLATFPAELAWTVLSPIVLRIAPTDRNDNENSLVLLLTFGAVSFLFTGDIESIPDGATGSWVVPLAPFVLKAPHHGRTHSATLALTEWLAPNLVVVSTGDSVPETATAITQHGIPVLSTSTCGTIRIRTDGESVWVTTDTLSAQVVDCTD